MDNFINSLIQKLEKGEEISPFLCIGKNTELLWEEIKTILEKVLKHFSIPKAYLYTLSDDEESIKIKEVQRFIEQSYSTPPYKFQIFFIENISRFTLGAGNSLLKFLEEPWEKNLVFLSNAGENNILDTILSRVQVVQLGWQARKKKSEFYQDMLTKYFEKNDNSIIKYFFWEKKEKREYTEALENIILYAKEKRVFIEFLDEILDDINKIEQNNLVPKYILDKWLLTLPEHYE